MGGSKRPRNKNENDRFDSDAYLWKINKTILKIKVNHLIYTKTKCEVRGKEKVYINKRDYW